MNKSITEWETEFIKYLNKNQFCDGSHDIAHFKRVWKTAKNILTQESDELIILASCYFHDIVSYPKNHPKRSISSKEASIKAEEILKSLGFPTEKVMGVKHCIESHSFSANIETETDEAKIVQDADRMESLGAIGLARTFYVAGMLGSKLFHELDPYAENRELDDKKFALDHFKAKLLKLPNTMKTKKGKLEAELRAEVLYRFLEDLSKEL